MQGSYARLGKEDKDVETDKPQITHWLVPQVCFAQGNSGIKISDVSVGNSRFANLFPF